MDPIVAAGLIRGASSLFGGGLSTIGQAQANYTNQLIAKHQNELNYKMFHEQNKFNIEQWNRNNEYNTPENQRKRYEQAGINPALALSNITPGTAQAVTSASPAPAVGAQMQNSLQGLGTGVSEFGNSLMSLESMKMQKRVADAQANYYDAKTAEQIARNPYASFKAKLEAGVLGAQRDNLDSSTHLNELNADNLIKLAPLQRQELISRISLTTSQDELLGIQKQLASYDLKNVKPLEKNKLIADIAFTYQNAKYLIKQGQLTESHIEETLQKITESRARILNINMNTKQIKTFLAPTVKKLESEARLNDAKADYTKEDASYLGQRNAQAWIFGSFGAIRDLGVGVGSITSSLSPLGMLTPKPAPMSGFSSSRPDINLYYR